MSDLETACAALVLLGALASLPWLLRGLARTLTLRSRLARASRSSQPPRRGEQRALAGEVSPLDLVESPYTGRKGVYVQAVLERLQGSTTGLGATWVAVSQLEEAAPFELRCAAGSVLVEPAGARFLVPTRTSTRGVERVIEAILEPAAPLALIGRVRDEEGHEPSAAYRGTTTRLVVDAGEHGLVLAPPATLRLALLRRALLQAAGALLATLALGVAGQALANRFPLFLSPPYRSVAPDDPSTTSRTPLAAGARPLSWLAELPQDVEVFDTVSFETWVLGAETGDLFPARFQARERGRAELERALEESSFSGIAQVVERRRRAWLVFEVISWTGQAFLAPPAEDGCRDQAWCRPAVEEPPAGE